MSNESDIREIIIAAGLDDGKTPREPLVRLIAGALDNLYHIRVALEKLAEKEK